MKSSGFGELLAPPTLKLPIASMAPVREVSDAGMCKGVEEVQEQRLVIPCGAEKERQERPHCLQEGLGLRTWTRQEAEPTMPTESEEAMAPSQGQLSGNSGQHCTQ